MNNFKFLNQFPFNNYYLSACIDYVTVCNGGI